MQRRHASPTLATRSSAHHSIQGLSLGRRVPRNAAALLVRLFFDRLLTSSSGPTLDKDKQLELHTASTLCTHAPLIRPFAGDPSPTQSSSSIASSDLSSHAFRFGAPAALVCRTRCSSPPLRPPSFSRPRCHLPPDCRKSSTIAPQACCRRPTDSPSHGSYPQRP